ncbi:MAG: oligosaccharide flippase family protein [Bacteroidetes bacterium]|nr:oligosaccharide flippase family protein [Bacteroidota bacterium]
MNPLKQLAGQTAVYGMATIIPRLLNFLLVPFYTRLMLESEYGVVTELYAYMATFFVILLYGMETTFFRYAEKEKDPTKVFSTSLISIFSTSFLFFILIWVFIQPISVSLEYPNHSSYILLAAGIVAIDAFTAIQFAYLRKQNKAFRFSIIKIVIVGVNVLLNIYFILLCDLIYAKNPDSMWLIFYQPDMKVTYILISNLIASTLGVMILLPQLLKTKMIFDTQLIRKMLKYTFPLLVVGIAGMINEQADKIIFKYLATIPAGVKDPNQYILSQLGIYGASYKLAVLMVIFIQMFRYAAEPFFFAQSKDLNAKKIYADVMKYFIIFCFFIFLGVILFMDVVQYLIGKNYREGLFIVPLILFSYLFQGIFYNLSIWYKLNDLTKYGAYIAIGGSVITILANIVLVPRYSYLGAAWGHFLCYLLMMVVSWLIGRKFYTVPYDMKRIGLYFALTIVIYFVFSYFVPDSGAIKYVSATLLFISFAVITFILERNNFKTVGDRR